MPASDPARQVHLGIKTGAFYGQEGGASETSDGGVVQREYGAPIAHDPPAAVTCHARVVIVTSLCL